MKEEMTNLEHELRESEAQAENSSLMSATHRSQASQAYDLKFRKYQQFNSAVKSYKFKQVPNYDGDDAGTMKKVLWSPKIRMGYIVHLIFKFTFEMIFFYSVYWYQTRQTGVSDEKCKKICQIAALESRNHGSLVHARVLYLQSRRATPVRS